MAVTFLLAEHVVCRKTNIDLYVLFDRQKGVMYELNESASAIVEQLKREPASLETLSAALVEDFEAPLDDIREGIRHMLTNLTDAGLVVTK